MPRNCRCTSSDETSAKRHVHIADVIIKIRPCNPRHREGTLTHPLKWISHLSTWPNCWRDNILEILKEKREYAAGCFLMRCFHCATVSSLRSRTEGTNANADNVLNTVLWRVVISALWCAARILVLCVKLTKWRHVFFISWRTSCIHPFRGNVGHKRQTAVWHYFMLFGKLVWAKLWVDWSVCSVYQSESKGMWQEHFG